jgi:hypothetical protein
MIAPAGRSAASALGLDAPAPDYVPTPNAAVPVALAEQDKHTPQALLAKFFFDLDLRIEADAYLLRVARLPLPDWLQGAAVDLHTGQATEATDGGSEGAADDDVAAALTAHATQATGVALSIGAVWWALRAGGLLAGLLGTLPTWRHVDLLAVLPDDDDDDDWDADDDAEALRDEQAVGNLLEPELEGDRR